MNEASRAAAQANLESRRDVASARTGVRRKVAVLLSRFPLVTETFILREVNEMERQGQPVRLVPLLRENPEVVHPEARPWMERALYTPYLSLPILVANLRMLRRKPLRYLGLLTRLLAGTLRSPNFFFRTVALFPKGVYLAERLEAEAIGHLHAHFATHPTTVALIVERLTGIGFSFTVHAHDVFVRRALLGTKIDKSRFVRSISRYLLDLMRHLYPETDGRKITLIHMGVDPSRYDVKGLPANPALHGPPLILSVAALKPYKGIPKLIEACRRLRDAGTEFRCEVVGEGPMRSRLQRQIDHCKLQEHVRLIGALPQHEVTAKLRRARLVVLSSVVAPDGQMEGIPISLMEAMATRCPVVSTSLSGIPELVEDGSNGILTQPGDDAAIADALSRILRDPELGRSLGERGREKVIREFQLQQTVRDLLVRIDEENVSAPEGLKDLLDAAGLGNRPLGLCSVQGREDSRVATILVGGEDPPIRVVVKQQLPRADESAPPAERARREFEILHRLERNMDSAPGEAGSFGVPRPVRLLEEEATILMEPCRGRSLVTWIRERRLQGTHDSREILARAVYRAGVWLRRFQECSQKREDARAHTDRLLQEAEALLRFGGERFGPGRGSEAILPRFGILAGQVRSEVTHTVDCHHDFWPGNIFLDADRVEVIDFEGTGPGLPEEDAAYFLVHLELFFAYPLLKQRFPALERSFLEGLLGTGPLRPPPTLRFCRAVAALRELARLSESRGRGRGWAARRRWALRRQVARSVAPGGRS